MITAHQNQIDQLRESFRQRISEADKWSTKVDDVLRKEREKHAADIRALEARLKDQHHMVCVLEIVILPACSLCVVTCFIVTQCAVFTDVCVCVCVCTGVADRAQQAARAHIQVPQ